MEIDHSVSYGKSGQNPSGYFWKLVDSLFDFSLT